MSKNLLILLSALGFFAIQESKPQFYNWNKSPSIRSFLPGLPLPQSPGKRMWIALITGERKILHKEERELFLRLGITHIFTPSGMHLTTLTVFMTKGRIFKTLSLLLASLMGFVGLFPAMTRVLYLKGTTRSFTSFCIVLLLEGIFFSWQRNDLSWICSWLFLGFCYFSPASHRALWFSLGQMLLCHIFFQEWSIIGMLLNLVIMLLLQIIFPALVFLSLLPVVSQNVPLWVLDNLFLGLSQVDKIHNHITLFIPHVGHLTFLVCWIMMEGRRRNFVLPILLLFLSSPLNQQKKSTFTQSKWEAIKGDHVRCKLDWKNQRWEEQCRLLKGRQHSSI